MSPTLMLSIYRAELSKLLSRLPARLGLIVALVMGVAMPMVVYGGRWAAFAAGTSMALSAGAPTMDWSPPELHSGLLWALRTRNFFVMGTFLILVGSVTFAAEYQARTLREDMLRAVPRVALLFAKWAALVSWAFASLLLTWIPCLLGSLVLMSGGDKLLAISAGFAASGLADVALVSFVFAVSVLTRSVPGTIAGVFLFYVLDYALGLALGVASALHAYPRGYEWVGTIVDQVQPWLFSSAMNAWKGWDPTVPWAWQGLVMLCLVIVGSFTASVAAFQRMDVP